LSDLRRALAEAANDERNMIMTRDEISRHETAIYRVLHGSAPRWLTNAEIAKAAGVARRTARLHTQRYAELGLIERAAVFPGHRFRWSIEAERRNADYVGRLRHALDVFATRSTAAAS
jgi:hypothetical protein